MAVQTYCQRSDIESVMGVPGVLACLDDDQDGVEQAEETLYLDACIERGAVEINMYISYQYTLSQVATNEWLKWANTYLAVYHLRARRNNTPDASIDAYVNDVRKMLLEIRWGRFRLPGQAPSFDSRPTISTFKPELNKRYNPIRVVVEESVGSSPPTGIKRNTSETPGIN